MFSTSVVINCNSMNHFYEKVLKTINVRFTMYVHCTSSELNVCRLFSHVLLFKERVAAVDKKWFQ